MFAVLAALGVVFIAVAGIIGAAVIYHLRQYTLPGWNAGRIAIALYLALALVCIGIVVQSLLAIPR